MSPPEVNPRALLRYSLTLLSRRDSHPVVSRNPGPLRIADLAGLLGDRVDPSQVPSQTRVTLLPTIPRARNDATHEWWPCGFELQPSTRAILPLKFSIVSYAEDNGANKGGRHQTPTAFPVLEVPAGLIRETESCRDALRSGPARDQ